MKTGVTLTAIEKYMALHVIVVGIVQLIAVKAPKEMIAKAKCWQRTNGSRKHVTWKYVDSVIKGRKPESVMKNQRCEFGIICGKDERLDYDPKKISKMTYVFRKDGLLSGRK